MTACQRFWLTLLPTCRGMVPARRVFFFGVLEDAKTVELQLFNFVQHAQMGLRRFSGEADNHGRAQGEIRDSRAQALDQQRSVHFAVRPLHAVQRLHV